MADKRSQRRSDDRYVDEEGFVGSSGAVGWLVDRAFDNPATTGGLFVMVVTAGAIVSNALFMQSVRHPEPLFSTRPPLVVDRHVPSTPTPPRRNDQTGAIAPPIPRAAPASVAPASEAPAEVVEESLLREIQSALASKGLYLGAIDGVYGTLSQSAITAYQKAEGLAVTGEPSADLLEHLKASKAAEPQAAAGPRTQPPGMLPEVAESVADGERLRYKRVQAALNNIGYGPVAVDGDVNDETTSAIRRFELDNGLPISGVAGDAVIDRLIAIGALPAT